MNANVPTLPNVKTSLRIAKFRFRDAVAGVPVAEAVTEMVWRGVEEVGMPTRVVVGPDVVDNDSPVPVNPGADH